MSDRDILVDCRNIRVSVDAMYSKSMAHRYLFCAFMSGSLGMAADVVRSMGTMPDDVAATLRCLEALEESDEQTVRLKCGESGTTARMIIPLAAALGADAVIETEGTLRNRPVAQMKDALIRNGACVSCDGDRTKISGQLRPGRYDVSGSVSSQYISGLLLALPLLDGVSEIAVEDRIQSLPYVEMTRSVMGRFGVSAGSECVGGKTVFHVNGAQKYVSPSDAGDILEGDWSSGAMWLAVASLLGEEPEVRGLKTDSVQGDRAIVGILERFDDVRGEDIVIDVSDTPDIVPAIALRAVLAGVTTRIVNAGRLRLKECDRLNATADVLRSLGADIQADPDGLTIRGTGGKLLHGSDEPIETYGDHRMVMLAALASAVTSRPVRVSGYGAVSKSYPDFFKAVTDAGGRIWE